MPHRTFRRIPASTPDLIQPTLDPSPYWPYFLRSPMVTVSQSGFNMGSDLVLTGRIRARFGPRFQKSSKNRYFRNRTILNGSNNAGSVGISFQKQANLALQKLSRFKRLLWGSKRIISGSILPPFGKRSPNYPINSIRFVIFTFYTFLALFGWTRGHHFRFFRKVLREKCTRKKNPEIALNVL